MFLNTTSNTAELVKKCWLTDRPEIFTNDKK